MKSKITSLIGLTSFLALVACGSSDPECGSALSQKLVGDIAKENQPNKLTNYIYLEGFSLSVFEKFKEITPTLSVQTYAELANKAWDQETEQWLAFFNSPETNSAWEMELDKISYKVSEIVTNTVDPETKNLTCAGKLIAESTLGGSQLDITFDVKPTSDGLQLVTVYGLQD